MTDFGRASAHVDCPLLGDRGPAAWLRAPCKYVAGSLFVDMLRIVIGTIFIAFAGVAAAANYAAWRWAALGTARAVLWLSVAPSAALLVYATVQLALAVITNDMRYLGADIGFAIVLVGTLSWVSIIHLCGWLGRASRG